VTVYYSLSEFDGCGLKFTTFLFITFKEYDTIFLGAVII